MSKFSKGIFFIFFCISFFTRAQSPINASFHHLTTEGGLSNSNVFSIFKDSRGFMWFGTLNGLSRFDGLQCKVYKPNNSGIRGVSVKNITEDKEGNLWVGSEEGLNFYDRKKDEFTYIKIKNHKGSYEACPFLIDDRGILWLNILERQLIGCYTFDVKKMLFVKRSKHASNNFFIPSKANFKPLEQHYVAGHGDVGYTKITFKNYKEIKAETFFDGKNNLPALGHLGDYIFVENDSTIWLTGNDKGLFKFNPKTLKYSLFSNKINYFTRVIPYKNYLVMGSNEGVFVFDKHTETFVQRLQYSNSNAFGPSSNWSEVLYIDKDDNLFLSNLGPGVDYTNLNRAISETWLDTETSAKLGYNDNDIQHVLLGKNEIYAKYQNGPEMVLDMEGKFKRKYEHHVAFITDSFQRQWLFNGRELVCVNPDSKLTTKFFFEEFKSSKGWEMQLVEIEPHKYIVSCPKGLFEFDEKANKLIALTEFNKVRRYIIKPLYFDKATKQLFVISSWWSDFFSLKKKNNVWEVNKEISNANAYGIRPSLSEGYVWLCTHGGLCKMNTSTFEIKKITEKDGLPDDFVTDIIEEPSGNYFVVTGKGIAYYDKKYNNFRSFTSKDGIYATEVDWNCAFKLPDGRAIFGGTNGISVINKESLKTYTVKPKVQITELIINEKIFNAKKYIGETENLVLKAEQNSFGLQIVGLEYGFPQKVKLQYQLEGVDKQWITTSNPTIARYTNVIEGEYVFKVKATDEEGKVASETKLMTITVHAPFYRTTWFRSLLLFGFVLLGYILYRLRTAQIRRDTRKKEEIKRIRAESEINALRSQMNPHFIFNCLNTVDSFILRNKTEEASEFLNKFSRLIRMILENAREDYIPLEQDVEALELYVFLEQERSHPKFAYDIHLSPKLRSEGYFVPATIVQPFVENAILHGLKHLKNTTGMLKIDFGIETNLLKITIEDNGIGRVASAKIYEGKNLQKKSLGIQITEERIKKINELYLGKSKVEIFDGLETGTRVEITLPLLTETELKL
jgi:ligand-binding sensor domain-containing protein